MANESGITYYELVSNYSGDTTKNCGLTIDELDGNFHYLRGLNITEVKWGENNELILVKDNGEELSAGELGELVTELSEDLDKQAVVIDELCTLYEYFDDAGRFKQISFEPVDTTVYDDNLFETIVTETESGSTT